MAANGASMLSIGKVYTVIPTKPVLVASILVYTVASIVCAIAKGSPVFIAGRVLAGIACAGVQVGTQLYVHHDPTLFHRPIRDMLLTSTI